MTPSPDVFEYPLRRYGMDHDRYHWSLLQRRSRVDWPQGKRIALWITVAVEHFPLDDEGQPFRLPGAVSKPYPDLQTYSWRDYGNRVGIYRVMKALDKFGVSVDWAVNASAAEMLPGLMRDIDARGEEVIAHGWDMGSPHHGEMDVSEESALVDRTLAALGAAVSSPIRGWMSPGKSQSSVTLDLLAKAGMDYCCDWPNDDMPYAMDTEPAGLIAMPHTSEMDDHKVIVALKHHESVFFDQVINQYRFLAREAERDGGRILSLNLHPWVIGQSHRIGLLERILEVLSQCDDVWNTSGSAILDCWRNSQPG